jgi:hypothetical protein
LVTTNKAGIATNTKSITEGHALSKKIEKDVNLNAENLRDIIADV